MPEPLVSICCLTYNHEPYIRECIEGFLMQKTEFPFEVLIHDDASTDNTSTIIREYEAKYPEIIKPIYQTENQFSKGIKVSITLQYPRSKGKYIAICEGDDYWTDPHKLQKQIDLLEMNSKYALCFHEAYKNYLLTGKKERFNTPQSKNEFTTSDLILRPWFVPTASIVFRKEYLPENYPEWYLNSVVGDMPLMLYLSKYGNLYCIRDKMSIYRIGAAYGATIRVKNNPIPNLVSFINLIRNANIEYFNKNYQIEVFIRVSKIKMSIYLQLVIQALKRL